MRENGAPNWAPESYENNRQRRPSLSGSEEKNSIDHDPEASVPSQEIMVVTAQKHPDWPSQNEDVDESVSNDPLHETSKPGTTDRLSFLAVCFVVLCINSTFSLMAPIFPTEAERRGIPPIVTGVIFSVYNFGNCIVSPFLGQLMQRRIISRLSMMAFGVVFSSAAMVGFGLAKFIPDSKNTIFSIVCLLLRTLNGLGAAATDTSSMAITAQMFQHTGWLGTALGIQEACLAIGWMIGPLIGGYLAVWGGFSLSFYVASGVGILLLPLVYLLPNGQVSEDEGSPRRQFQKHISPWSLLRHLEITLFLISAALSAAAVTFLDATLAPYLQDRLRYSEGTIGDCFAFIAASYASGTLLGGWLSDIWNPRPVIMIGLLISVIPFAIIAPSPLLQPFLCHLGVEQGVWVWISLGLLGAGCAFGFSPVPTAILSYAEQVNIKDEGLPDLVGGFAASSYYLGGGAGPLIGGSLTNLVGFDWATTIYGFGLLLFSSISVICLMFSRHNYRRQILPTLQNSLLTN